MIEVVGEGLQPTAHSFAHNEKLICLCIDALMDDFFVCLVLMHCLHFALHEVDEGIKPLERLSKLKKHDVVGMTKMDVRLLMQKNAFFVFFVVTEIDDNPSEKTEWCEIASFHHQRVALSVFQSESSSNLAADACQVF